MLILCGSVSKNNIDSYWKLDKKEVKDAGKKLAAKNMKKYHENQRLKNEMFEKYKTIPRGTIPDKVAASIAARERANFFLRKFE